ncbi:MAG TPA: hypothetical protein VKI40_09515 [Terriglobales bacterium]|nr:hypothetical protein [Terriglobales bacterium]
MPKKISEIYCRVGSALDLSPATQAELMLKAIGKKLREVGKDPVLATRFFQNEAAQEILPPRKPKSKSPRKRG